MTIRDVKFTGVQFHCIVTRREKEREREREGGGERESSGNLNITFQLRKLLFKIYTFFISILALCLFI